jgi:hypothetical protein
LGETPARARVELTDDVDAALDASRASEDRLVAERVREPLHRLA